MQLDWPHILKELMFFSCWKTFGGVPCCTVLSGNLFLSPWVPPALVRPCTREKSWDIQKAEHYKPALSDVQKQHKLLLLQVRAALLRQINMPHVIFSPSGHLKEFQFWGEPLFSELKTNLGLLHFRSSPQVQGATKRKPECSYSPVLLLYSNHRALLLY